MLNSVPRQNIVQRSRHQARTKARMEKRHQRRPNGRTTKTNRRDTKKKATATALKINDYCYVLNPKADKQSIEFAFKDCIWTGLYIVVTVLSNEIYEERKTGTQYTQILQ